MALESIRLGRFRGIRHPGSGRWELYDLDQDPGETRDLARGQPERVKLLEARLERMLEENPPVAPPLPGKPDPEMQEQLRALGYVE